MKNIRQLLWRIPVLLGISALVSHGARATVPDASGDADRQRSQIGQVLVRLENDKIYFSQDAGQTFQELQLKGTPEAARLKQLLQRGDRSGPAGVVKVSPTVVADGAGGAQWARPKDAYNTGGRATEAGASTKPVIDKDAVRGPKGSVQSKPE
jgi:hypothetical protein